VAGAPERSSRNNARVLQHRPELRRPARRWTVPLSRGRNGLHHDSHDPGLPRAHDRFDWRLNMNNGQTDAKRQPTMMALRAHRRGGPEQLIYEEAPRPIPGPDEVCIAVRAAAITFAELTWPETWTADGEIRHVRPDL
jgi:hypothetical protein